MRRLACGLLLSLVVLALARPVAAGDPGLTNTETFSGFQFNFNNPGARALGMGGAFVAVADDATAVVANPAGLMILQRPEISAEYKYTRFRNTINAFTNTPTDGATNNTVHDRNFDDSVNTPSFFSFVYPTERVVLAAFVRELINYKSKFNTDGVFLSRPHQRHAPAPVPVQSELEITALNFGLGAAVNLEKENPLAPEHRGEPRVFLRPHQLAAGALRHVRLHRAAEPLRSCSRPRPSTAPISASGSTSACCGTR